MNLWTPAVASQPQPGTSVWVYVQDWDQQVRIGVWDGYGWLVFHHDSTAGPWIESCVSGEVTFWMPMDWPEFREPS